MSLLSQWASLNTKVTAVENDTVWHTSLTNVCLLLWRSPSTAQTHHYAIDQQLNMVNKTMQILACFQLVHTDNDTIGNSCHTEPNSVSQLDLYTVLQHTWQTSTALAAGWIWHFGRSLHVRETVCLVTLGCKWRQHTETSKMHKHWQCCNS